MTELSLAAQKVKEALAAKNLETPSCRLAMDNCERKSKIEAHFREIMKLMELDLTDDSLAETPHRVSKMYVDEIFSGLYYENFPKITLIENKMQVDEMITVRDITLTSVCEHHFVTIDGKATVSYIPKDKVIGLSKINRIVEFFSQRPQVQERLTQQILVALQTLLGTVNVAVSIDATHYCVKARGIKDSSSMTTTTALGGGFKTNPSTRQEFLRALNHY
ncbi:MULTISPECIES: GTP cyclohydrolase I FolE [unclassified Gilliamella]|jgi:GTP cyclohydrolase IA|uniref:GTP cyclohydrolase I FolE n=1 Tax=unclassified Gilliamella TaxID=2685620 RepID=UPI001309C924|nr:MULTISPECIES: GTP cyclohydrolase I FolE [unclassified Gilliamella]MWP49164.1 GTP cyclohydrolase I FolE [Gilliamella sp. Lep-s35]MWP68043.1 GTP cyclohydrolase I FolE [Gilliamella sp. Lep-s5]MWP76263.1 GTP cyclohydrolase I FolE [Gilliamella sp. Lep-s21]